MYHPSGEAVWQTLVEVTTSLKTLVVIPLLGRVSLGASREQVLESPLRRTILEIVKTSPGIPVGELMRRADLGWGTLYHHLSKLARAGLVTTTIVGRRRLVYPARTEKGLQEDAPAAALLRGRTASAIARVVAEKKARSILAISEATGESPRAVYYHVKRLVEAGLVESASETRYHTLTATPRLLEALGQTEDATPDGGPH